MAKAAAEAHDRVRLDIEVLPQNHAPIHSVERAAGFRPEQRALDSVVDAGFDQIPTPGQFLLADGMSPLSDAPTRLRIAPAWRALPRSEFPTLRGYAWFLT